MLVNIANKSVHINMYYCNIFYKSICNIFYKSICLFCNEVGDNICDFSDVIFGQSVLYIQSVFLDC